MALQLLIQTCFVKLRLRCALRAYPGLTILCHLLYLGYYEVIEGRSRLAPSVSLCWVKLLRDSEVHWNPLSIEINKWMGIDFNRFRMMLYSLHQNCREASIGSVHIGFGLYCKSHTAACVGHWPQCWKKIKINVYHVVYIFFFLWCPLDRQVQSAVISYTVCGWGGGGGSLTH